MIQTTSPEIGGMGHSVKRKEDARFIQGKGNYVDDVHLPGMVFGHVVRSPYGHARLKSVNIGEAMKVPGALAVITGADLAAAGLAWMPTLFHDKQMVLATGKVLFQAQEVAFCVATEQYAAADMAELVEVEYDELPVLVDPHKALDPDAPILRDDREEKSNHIFHWEVGDKQGTAKGDSGQPGTAKVDAVFQRCHPAPLETCGCVADFNPVNSKLTIWLTSQAPHAHRTLFSIVGGIPEHNIRVISPDIGGGFGNKVPIYPGYVCAVVASLKLGRPVKWIETRSENLQSTGFARDYHMTAEIAAERDGTVKALRVKTLADHGAFNAAAQPSKFPAGLFSICTGSYDFPKAFCEVDGVYTNKAPGGIAYRCSFRVTEAAYLIERAMDVLAHRIEDGPGRVAAQEFHPIRQIPLPVPAWLDLRQRRLCGGDEPGAENGGIPGSAQGAGRKTQEGRADGDRHLELHRDRGRGSRPHLRYRRHQDVRQLRDSHPPHRQSDRAAGDEIARARATRPPSRRSSRRNWAFRSGYHAGRRRHRYRALWPGHIRQPQHAGGRALLRPWRPRKIRDKARRSPRTCWKSARRIWNGSPANSSSKARPRRPKPFRKSPSPPTPTSPRAWRLDSKPCITTIRPT